MSLRRRERPRGALSVRNRQFWRLHASRMPIRLGRGSIASRGALSMRHSAGEIRRGGPLGPPPCVRPDASDAGQLLPVSL